MIWYIVGIIEIFIFSRILVAFTGANIHMLWMYRMYIFAELLVKPFELFIPFYPIISLSSDSFLDITPFIAGLIYLILGFILVFLVKRLTTSSKK